MCVGSAAVGQKVCIERIVRLYGMGHAAFRIQTDRRLAGAFRYQSALPALVVVHDERGGETRLSHEYPAPKFVVQRLEAAGRIFRADRDHPYGRRTPRRPLVIHPWKTCGNWCAAGGWMCLRRMIRLFQNWMRDL